MKTVSKIDMYYSTSATKYTKRKFISVMVSNI